MTDLPLIVLQGLEGNSPTHLYGAQGFIVDNLDMIQFIWWTVFAVTLALVMTQVVRALVRSWHRDQVD